MRLLTELQITIFRRPFPKEKSYPGKCKTFYVLQIKRDFWSRISAPAPGALETQR